MPEDLERKLRAEAEKKFPGEKRLQDRYVYGTLRERGWKPKQEPPKPAKGK